MVGRQGAGSRELLGGVANVARCGALWDLFDFP